MGTRLLPVTKEQPKEMMPVFSWGKNGASVKPVAQLIFEQIYEFGIRDFCIVVGRGKRAMEDHFTPDPGFEELVKERGLTNQAAELRRFYEMVENSSIQWMNQPKPLGFGHAVALASTFAGGEPVLVHAGDNHVTSGSDLYLRRMVAEAKQSNSDATILLREIEDPRRYGVAVVDEVGDELIVKDVEEKPAEPKSKLALLPVYIFGPEIFGELKKIKTQDGTELQLTDGIQGMIRSGLKVNAVKLNPDEFWLDVGTPDSYWDALQTSYRKVRGETG